MTPLIGGVMDDCQIIELYRFLGKKWTVPLLHNIGKDPVSFNTLLKTSQKGLNPTLLSETLKSLVEFKIVEKRRGREGYVLTEKGTELKSILHQVKDWAIVCEYNLPSMCKAGGCACDRGCQDCP